MPDEDQHGQSDRAEVAGITELLAAARVVEPMPADVAARLDAALAGLDREEAVLPLRRRLGPWLVAAASVVLLLGGVAIGTHQLVGGRADTSVAGSAHDSSVSTSAPEAQPESSPSPSGSPGKDLVGLGELTAAPVRIRRSAFAADAARVVASADVPATTGHLSNDQGGEARRQLRASTTCSGPGRVHTVTVPVLLDGAPAALVILPRVGPAQRVQAWSCDGSELLQQATVPAP